MFEFVSLDTILSDSLFKDKEYILYLRIYVLWAGLEKWVAVNIIVALHKADHGLVPEYHMAPKHQQK